MPLGTEVGLGPGDIVLDGANLLPAKGHTLNFWLMSIAAKWLPISAAAELLLLKIVSDYYHESSHNGEHGGQNNAKIFVNNSLQQTFVSL